MENIEKAKTFAPSFEELTSEDREFVDGYIEEIYEKLQMSHVAFIKRTLSEYVTKYVIKSKDLVIREEVENEKIIFMYKKTLKIAGRKEKSIEQYDLCIKDFNHFINKPFNKIDEDDIRSWLLKLKEKDGNCDSTINGKRGKVQHSSDILLMRIIFIPILLIKFIPLNMPSQMFRRLMLMKWRNFVWHVKVKENVLLLKHFTLQL